MEKTKFEQPFEQPFAEEFERALFKQKVKDFFKLRNTRADMMKMVVSAMFYKGTPQKPIKFICATKGHMVNAANIGLSNFFSANSTAAYAAPNYTFGVGSDGVPTVPSMRIGVGVGATTASMSALVTITATKPSSISGVNSVPVAAKYRTAITATWNAGTLGAITVTEAALYMFLMGAAQNAFGAAYSGPTIYMADRISSTDVDFGSFVVDVAKPLSFQYNIEFLF